MLKKNLKLFIGIIIGAVVFGSIGAYAASKIYANNITVDTTNMSELGASSDVNAALDYLYGKASKVSSTLGELPEGQTYYFIAYLDPTNLTRKCSESDVVSTTGTKTGCMKWYVFNEDRFGNYSLLLDHNTTAKVAYNSETSDNVYSNSASYSGMKEAGTELENLVNNSNWEVMPRLITAYEVAEIVGADKYGFDPAVTPREMYLYGAYGTKHNWRVNDTTATSTKKLAWLFDRTYNCTSNGCDVADSSTNGYWTSSSVNITNGHYNLVWGVSWNGMFGWSLATNNGFGIRPVIDVPKSLFE